MPYTLPLPDAFADTIDGKHTHLYVLANTRGMQVALSDYGARIVSLLVPDKDANLTDVVLGFDSIGHYLHADEQYHGATVGRYANRIAKGVFQIGGHTYNVEPNNGPNALHGGKGALHQKIWDTRSNDFSKIEFSYVSPDGDNGFPGTLSLSVSYELTDDNEIIIRYRASSDKPTIINLTNHAYFNLNGEGQGDVLNHELMLNADFFLPIDETQIPKGEPKQVANTAFDFRKTKTIGNDILAEDKQLIENGGYDHCYVLRKDSPQKIALAGTAYSPLTGIRLDVLTSEPGVQLYTGNWLSGKDIGKSGTPYHRYGAFCLETQHYPDAPNRPDFPSTRLEPGQAFLSETRYLLSTQKG